MTIEQLSAALPDQITLQKVIYSYAHPQASGLESYVDLVIADGGILNGTLDGYCIDVDRPIDFELDNNRNGIIDTNEVGDSYRAKVYSSYGSLPAELIGLGLIEKPENLDLLNWIINQNFAGQASADGFGNYTFADVQRAIWTLIDDTNTTVGIGAEGALWKQSRVDQIVNAARANGEGFVPGFGQKMGVIIVPETNADNLPDAQIMFAAVELSKLGDKVFEDHNADGIQDLDDTGIAGVRVNLLADLDGDGAIAAHEVIASTTTDPNGDYSFTVIAGDYKVQFETPQGFEGVSPANQGGNDAIDSDGLISDLVTLSPGENDTTIDSGFYRQASLGDRVWYDTNQDGIQDANEAGVAGVKVTLTGGGADHIIGTADDTTVSLDTDANGNYRFDHLNIGEEYQVQFSNLPNGYEFTQADSGSQDGLDSDANPTTGTTQIVTLSSGEHNPTLDAGIVAKPSSLGDRVWYDTNKNGIQDANEQGVAGIKVTLTGGGKDDIIGNADDTLATATTDANGTYKFENLNAGEEYQIQFANLPGGYQFTQADAGSNDAVDSDANSAGLTQKVTLAPGEHNPTLDAGIVRKPICAKLVGTTGINEGSQGNYFIQLDSVSDRDRYFTVQVDNGSAKRVDQWAGNQDIMWGGYYDTRDSYGRVIKKTYGYVAQGRAGDTRDDRKVVGPADASWDYTLYQNGAIDPGNTITIKVAAGQSASNPFQVQTWKERVTLDRDAGNSAGYLEGTETLSMKVIAADADRVCNDHLDVSIYDKTTYEFVSPIALDLNGDGIQTLSLDRGISFDLLNTGEKIQTGWLSGQDGFLAIDNNDNGQIDDRSELFGGGVGEGFAKLASFDSNGDGWVNSADVNFGQLQIWQDSNEDAITNPGELVSLAAAGIESLKVSYINAFNLDAQGNMLGERSMARSSIGQSLDMVDVYFQVGGNGVSSTLIG